ncbi:hypothetical protein EVAR_61088_1 [Eumeta japonica]|uniref:Uncharacterized protein n=1 Tax=Eumeta variegata TaxID=151549 RepID=A0A4C1YLM8_EUMVA|nr:hypothetical protein EVAR_61088_1 [Eumeta japonica]
MAVTDVDIHTVLRPWWRRRAQSLGELVNKTPRGAPAHAVPAWCADTRLSERPRRTGAASERAPRAPAGVRSRNERCRRDAYNNIVSIDARAGTGAGRGVPGAASGREPTF